MATAGRQRAHEPAEPDKAVVKAGRGARDALLARLMSCIGHDLGNLVFLVKARRDLLSDATRRGISENPESLRAHYDSLHRTLMGLWWAVQDPMSERLGARDTDLAAWWHVAEPMLRCAVPRGAALHGRVADGLPRAAVQPHALTQAVADALFWATDACAGPHRARILAEAGPDGAGLIVSVSVQHAAERDSGPSAGAAAGHPPAPEVAAGVIARAGGSMEAAGDASGGRVVTLFLRAAAAVAADMAVGRPRLARVNVAHESARAAATAALRSWGFEVSAPGLTSNEGVSMWVVDSAEATPVQLQEFVGSGKGCWAVVVGRAGLEHDRIVEVADGDDASLLAVAVGDVAETLDRREGDLGPT